MVTYLAVLAVLLTIVTLLFAYGLWRMQRLSARIERAVDRVEQTATDGRARADRANVELAATLARMQKAAAVVALNLADAGARADDAQGGEGAAADAASRTGTQ